MTFAFRPDIQILRGWAVLSVFVFHLLPAWMPAGFLGVDLFFVLSGFLMAAIYNPSAPNAARGFFLNRIRRILPAYYTVLLAIVVVAAFRILPHEFSGVRENAIYSALLLPNIGYWLDYSYFAVFRPGLHLWSVGMEFQFYVLVPAIIWSHARYPRTLLAMALASFAACILIVGVRPRHAFFLLPFRMWEFFFGFYAYHVTRLWSDGRVPQSLAWISVPVGLCMIAVMFIPISEIAHPIYAITFLTAATAVMLVVGMPTRIVSSPPGRAMVIVGQYSYSIYLVHYPVIAYWFYRPFEPVEHFTASAIDIVVVTGLTAILSVALYHLVENPMRKTQSTRRLFGVQASLVGAMIVIFAIGTPIQQMILPPQIVRISEAWEDHGPERCGTTMLLNFFSRSCALAEAPSSRAANFLLVGSSHADAIKTAMADVARQTGNTLYLFRENCVLGTGGCTVGNILDAASSIGAKSVILHNGPGDTHLAAVRQLVSAATDKGIKVVLIDPVPVFGGDVLQGLYEAQISSKSPGWMSQSIEQYRTANADFLRNADAIREPGFSRYNPAELLCAPNCRVVSPDGRPLYFDSGHLTHTGARELSPMFRSIFADLPSHARSLDRRP